VLEVVDALGTVEELWVAEELDCDKEELGVAEAVLEGREEL
jgi:hypothetical protein